ncbi:MAG: hypothetical protein U0324_19225 [Polyangiales bacterium]
MPTLRAAVLPLVLSACAAAPRAGTLVARAEPPPPRVIRGVVRYEARHPTAQGTSAAAEVRPARFVEVVARDVAGTPVGSCEADGDGAFSCAVSGSAKTLAFVAHARHDGLEASCTPDSDQRRLHELAVELPPGGAEVELTIRDGDAAGTGGAFHIVDTVMRGVEAAKRWTGATLPPLVVYWGRGVTTEWSYYRGERPAGSGRFVLELLGGQRGRHTTTDTDEHDEAIVLHEVGHFVMDRLTTNSSPGGTHPSNVLIDPGLAWEEGRATWFAAAVRRDPAYQDTIGVEPAGSLRVDHDLERSGGPRGNGAENSVADVLWDLTDGFENYPDRDHDGVALGPEAVLRAMVDMNHSDGAFPCLTSFLEFVTARQALAGGASREALLTPDAVAAMLRATQEPDALMVRSPDARWPLDLAVPGVATDKVDGLTSPAPSGGPRRPENGYDALRVYRVRVTQRAWLGLELNIQGSGRQSDHTDLDLELRDLRGEVIAAARGEGPRETLSRLLQPGWYIVYVRDGGAGNRANFELRTRLRPV